MLTQSTMMPLGTQAPDFELRDVVSGKTFTLPSFAGQKALLVIFLCNHCPYVQHVKGEISRLGREYGAKGVGVLAISANDADVYTEDAPEMLRALAEGEGFTFPLCYDRSQKSARAYTAACTPDFFLFDAARKLVYRGQLDDSRPGNEKPVTGRDLRAALDAVLAGKPVNPNQKPSSGCNIKWKPGNEPEYFGA